MTPKNDIKKSVKNKKKLLRYFLGGVYLNIYIKTNSTP
ncbi:hypothetical protein SAMN05216293_2954 [Flagellimonas taeanensis]|uniref:Uncharacterized protein n=1 Tax=Flagellimonas taeanensis TaxID=1005926 RepID=A0A1M6YUA2_9FLAO|nr:hypothetical protein SAMN05216293_2954 [Allomuricauda taeanensis]